MSALKKAAFAGLLSLLFMAGCAPQSGPMMEASLTNIPQYGKFIWHDLVTDDVTAARAFYGPLMGWSFETTRRPGGGPYTLIVSSAGNYVGGMVELQDPADGEDYSRWLGYYAVPSVDKAVAAALEAGGTVVVDAQNLANVARVAAIQDPDGAVVGLITSGVGFPKDRAVVGDGEIAWNELLAANPPGVAAFYASLASGSVQESLRGENVYYVLSDKGLERAGIMARPDAQVTPLWLTYFVSGDAARAADKAATLGGKIIVRPQSDIRDGSIALIEDPTGAIFGLQQPVTGVK